MSHLQCPNIKIDILNLRSKIGELKLLKINILRDDPEYQNHLSTLQSEIDSLVVEINKKIDGVVNETILSMFKNNGKYKSIGDFFESRAVVQDKSGNWFHIKPNGERAYAGNYSAVGNFSEGRAAVLDMNNKCFHIKPNGERAYAGNYRYVGDFDGGRALAENMNGNGFYIDINGNRLPD